MEMYIVIRSILFSIVIVNVFSSAGKQNKSCSSSDHGCCSNEFWDKDYHLCKPCTEGYVGPNCSIMCKYPLYGKDCLQTCHCNGSFCDFQIGCQLLTDSTIIDDLTSTQRSAFEKNFTLPDNFSPSAMVSITHFSSVSYNYTTNYTTGVKESPLLYLIVVLSLLFITGISVYFIFIIYMKWKSNVHWQMSKISGPESAHYEEPSDLVHLHI
ncbi:uncharacterized protein LOC134276429 [Saccostrea cucullata]|uniref:uncharacterized protein LOC134276429 n=1 Tax=Saccostrea cuccullata TaxID=36930 RepID=UPI002ECFC4A2